MFRTIITYLLFISILIAPTITLADCGNCFIEDDFTLSTPDGPTPLPLIVSTDCGYCNDTDDEGDGSDGYGTPPGPSPIPVPHPHLSVYNTCFTCSEPRPSEEEIEQERIMMKKFHEALEKQFLDSPYDGPPLL